MVEYLLDTLIRSYGRFGSYRWKDAVLGEKVGKWKIVRRNDGKANQAQDVPKTIDHFGLPHHSVDGVHKRKIAWVQDDFIVGGAEISNSTVTGVGVDCGCAIELVTPSTDPITARFLLEDSDVVVLNNMFGFSKVQMRMILEVIYAIRKPYVKYEHDHRELSRVEFSRKLFQNSRLNVFLSPMHMRNHVEALNCSGIALPLAIDVDMFRQIDGVERKPNTAVVCNVRNFKQWSKLQDYVDDHRDVEFTVMADDPVVQGSNVKTRKKVPHEDMPALYSEFEYVVHILDGLGAGERVVFEGALCGCRIVANDGVGHMSWNRDLMDIDSLREWLREAPYAFWREVDKIS